MATISPNKEFRLNKGTMRVDFGSDCHALACTDTISKPRLKTSSKDVFSQMVISGFLKLYFCSTEINQDTKGFFQVHQVTVKGAPSSEDSVIEFFIVKSVSFKVNFLRQIKDTKFFQSSNLMPYSVTVTAISTLKVYIYIYKSLRIQEVMAKIF